MSPVRDIWTKGGRIPMPNDVANNSRREEQKQDSSPREHLEEAMKTIAVVKQLQALENINTTQPVTPQPKAEEKTTLDVSKIVESQNNLVASLITQLTEMLRTRPDDPFIKHLTEEVSAVKQRLEMPNVDPVESLLVNVDKLKKLTETMKDHLGLSSQPQISDLPHLLQLEQLRIDAAERQRQHEERMEELRHQHRLEMLRWRAEFNLKLHELEESKRTKEKAMGTLEDLAASLAESINVERITGTGKRPEKVSVESENTENIRIPKTYKCEVCGTIIEVPKDHDVTEPITCPGCGMVYELVEEM